MNFTSLLTGRFHLIAILASVVCCVQSVGCQRNEDLGPVARASTSEKIRAALAEGSEATGGGAASTGTGWATIKGRFLYDGEPPVMPPYGVNKDQAACTVGGTAPPQEMLVVDSSSKGIANIAVYLRRASRVHESAEQPPEGGREFDQETCVFLTHVFAMQLGQSVEIKNSDPVGHNTNISGKNGLNQTIEAGKSISYLPQKEEAVPVTVRCSIHPWMLAYFLPRENGYFAVTGPDGSFEIPNVPAGEDLEVQVWHESATGPGGALVLGTPEAKELKWSSKGRFKVKLGEDEVKELELTVPADAFSI